jgi:TRAP-type C4-dicarboxylate transport system permease small subunit
VREAAMSAFSRIVRRLAAWGIGLAAATLIASMLLIAYAVVMRYFFNQPPPWVDELVGYLLVAAVMLATADALLQGEHIAVDIVTERLGARGRRITLLLGLVTVAVSGALLVNEGIDMVGFSLMAGLKSNGILATPMWVPQLLVPVGAALMTLAAITAFIDAWRGVGPPVDSGASHHPAGIE